MKAMLLILAMTFFCSLPVHARAVYVDSKTGNDNNDGGKGTPVFSIRKAAEIINSRDNDLTVIKINPGIYVLDSVDKPLPHDYMHVIPNTTGYEKGAGIFTKIKATQ